jgi:hypothetical protein
MVHRLLLFQYGAFRLGPRLLWPRCVLAAPSAEPGLDHVFRKYGSHVLQFVDRGNRPACRRHDSACRDTPRGVRRQRGIGNRSCVAAACSSSVAALPRSRSHGDRLCRNQWRFHQRHYRPLVRGQARTGAKPGFQRSQRRRDCCNPADARFDDEIRVRDRPLVPGYRDACSPLGRSSGLSPRAAGRSGACRRWHSPCGEFPSAARQPRHEDCDRFGHEVSHRDSRLLARTSGPSRLPWWNAHVSSQTRSN